MKNKKILLLLSILLLSSNTWSKGKNPIILGQSAPFSGPSSHLGQQPWLGAQTYIDEVNRKGGIHGQKIELIYLDDAYNPDKTEANTKELLSNPKLFSLFNYVGTPTVVKILPLVAEAKHKDGDMFLFANRTGAAQQRTPPFDKVVFNIRASYVEEGRKISEYLQKQKLEHIGLFLQDDAYGASGKNAISKGIEGTKINIVAETKYQRGAQFTESMTKQATELKAAKSDVIVSIASYRAAAALIRDLRSAGFTGPIINISFVGAQDMLNLLIEESDKTKTDITKNLLVSQVLPPVSETQIPIVAEYVKLTNEHFPKIPENVSQGETIKRLSISAMEGFINAKIFVEIAKRAKQPLTRASFIEAAESDFTLDLGLGVPFKFSKTEHQGLHEVWMTEVINREFKLTKTGP